MCAVKRQRVFAITQLSFNVVGAKWLKDLCPQPLLLVSSARNEASWKASCYFVWLWCHKGKAQKIDLVHLKVHILVLRRLLALLEKTPVMEMQIKCGFSVVCISWGLGELQNMLNHFGRFYQHKKKVGSRSVGSRVCNSIFHTVIIIRRGSVILLEVCFLNGCWVGNNIVGWENVMNLGKNSFFSCTV